MAVYCELLQCAKKVRGWRALVKRIQFSYSQCGIADFSYIQSQVGEMDDSSHEPDHDRQSFLIKIMAGGSILLSLLLTALLNWPMGKIQELRRKQKQERYKASLIYP
jgi:hypothetical protein